MVALEFRNVHSTYPLLCRKRDPPQHEECHHEDGDLSKKERVHSPVNVPEELRVPVFIGELIESFVLPAIEHLSRERLCDRRVAVEKGVVPVRERPKPRHPPAGADRVVNEVADGAEREEERPGRAERSRE